MILGGKTFLQDLIETRASNLLVRLHLVSFVRRFGEETRPVLPLCYQPYGCSDSRNLHILNLTVLATAGSLTAGPSEPNGKGRRGPSARAVDRSQHRQCFIFHKPTRGRDETELVLQVTFRQVQVLVRRHGHASCYERYRIVTGVMREDVLESLKKPEVK